MNKNNLIQQLTTHINEYQFYFDVANQSNIDWTKKEVISLVKKRINNLKNWLRTWEYEYYGLEKPTVSDFQYDQTLKELNQWETLLPNLKTKDSPTNKVGGNISNKFAKVVHHLPMLSLSNVFNVNELKEFDQRISKVTKEENNQYVVEPKFDGLSISLIYQKGKLIQGVTRGDGKIGEDVTKNILMIENIPHQIDNNLERFEVRGEVFLDFKQFQIINNAINDSDKKFANPRNAAAGTLRRLNPQLVKDRKLKVVAYFIPDQQNLKDLNIATQYEVIQKLKTYGFFTGEYTALVNDISSANHKINWLENNQNNLAFPIDGAVIKLNEINHYDALGKTSKFPHWATAYKFTPKEAKTTVLNIVANVGRTGKITYVANLEPVFLNGSTITNASLNNAAWISEKDIRIGDSVLIYKAAEIIPYVKEVVKNERKEGTKHFRAITHCPICGSKLERNEGEVDQYCINNLCPARILNSMIYFCSKPAMNIEGLSEKTLTKYFNLGLVKSISDIYRLNNHREEIVEKISNGKFKVFNKLIEAIEKSKNNSLEKLILGLGIRNVGSVSSLNLAKHFLTLDNLINASIEELTSLNDIGTVVAYSIYHFFHNDSNLKLIDELKSLGLNTKYLTDEVSDQNKNSPYYQKTFCITGSFDLSRNQIANLLIAKFDAKVVNSITKSLDYLIVGANPGSKEQKAISLSIKIINNKIWED